MKSVRILAWIIVLIFGVLLAFRFYGPGEDKGSGPGGPFTLTAHTGNQVSDTDFRGRYMMIYFGYSFCPDVCPLDLQKMTTALKILEDEGYDTSPIQPLFITVDPERDTVAELADFVQDFHPNLIALTGTLEDITAVTQKFRVYFAKRKQEGIDGYLMDHQAYIMVMDKDGSFNRLFTSRDAPQKIAEVFRPVLKKQS